MRDRLSQRPRIDVPKSHWDYVADALAFLGVLGSVWLLLALWTDLPSGLPGGTLTDVGSSAAGRRWGGTLPLSTAIIIYVMFRLLTRVPHYYNYPWPVTPENASIQYRLFRSMVFWLGAVIVWMLLLIAWSQLNGSVEQSGWFAGGLILGSIFLIHLVLGIFIYRAYQHRHGERSDDRDRAVSSQP